MLYHLNPDTYNLTLQNSNIGIRETRETAKELTANIARHVVTTSLVFNQRKRT